MKKIVLTGRNMGDISSLCRVLQESGKFEVISQLSDKDEKVEADCAVYSWKFPYHVKAPLSLSVGHGFGFLSTITISKPQFLKDPVRQSHMCFYGDKLMKQCCDYGHRENMASSWGMPFSIDLLAPINYYDKRTFLVSKGLDPAKDTVLYAPTWDRVTGGRRNHRGFFAKWFEDGKERERVANFVKHVTYNLDMNLIVRMHEHHRYSQDWLDMYSTELRKPNVYAIYANQDYNNLPYFRYSDILVGDVSGVNIYFYVMDKPVVHIDPYGVYGGNLKGDSGMALSMMPPPQVQNFDELLGEIFLAKDKPELYSEKRKAVVSEYIDYTGKDCRERIINIFEELLNGTR